MLIVFDGANWVDYAGLIALQNIPMLGVNATADSTNKLSVQSNAALFSDVPTGSGGSGDMRVTLSKQASGNTASLLLQDNFSGRAEIGLAGDDDLHFKVSPDGSAWSEALLLSGASGLVTLPKGQLAFPATQNASSDPNTLDDYEEGTFTPTYVTSSGSLSGVTYAAQFGRYTKIGNLVAFKAGWTLSNAGSGGSGTPRLAGLPFPSANDGNVTPQAIHTGNVTLDAGYFAVVGIINNNSDFVSLQENGSGVALANLSVSAISNISSVRMSGIYHTA